MCLTESILQSYIDADLGTEAMVSTRSHIDACEKCKSVLNEAITEQQLVRSALAHEMELPVPTLRLRARVYRAIEAGIRTVTIQ